MKSRPLSQRLLKLRKFVVNSFLIRIGFSIVVGVGSVAEKHSDIRLLTLRYGKVVIPGRITI